MNITDRTNLNRAGIGIFDDGKIASPIGWSINQQYQTLIIGDAYCGKSSYISSLVRSERLSNAPITMSDDQNEVEFWVKYRDCKAIFKVKDTGNLEKFRSLTQTHYKKAQCILLAFNLNNQQSVFNLKKWYTDIINYTNNQPNLAIVLIGLKSSKNDLNKPDYELIDVFQQEHNKIIGFCEFDLSLDSHKQNLKEPFEMLLSYYQAEMVLNNGRKSIISLASYSAQNYSTIDRLDERKLIDDDPKNRPKCCCIIV